MGRLPAEVFGSIVELAVEGALQDGTAASKARGLGR